MLFHVLHLVFTLCNGIATSCLIVLCSVIGPYVMSILHHHHHHQIVYCWYTTIVIKTNLNQHTKN